MNDFTNAKVGDKVYCLLFGEGIIVENYGIWDIAVNFSSGNYCCYTFEGKFNENANPTLYWNKPQNIDDCSFEADGCPIK